MLSLTPPKSFREAVREIEGFGVMPDRAPSLDPMTAGLREAGLIERFDPARVIVVAGTNGKGSTCAYLEALLLSAGQRVGLYTSPHLVSTTERIRLDAEDIPEERFLATYLKHRELCLRLRYSHFETLTLLALQAFSDEGLAIRASDSWIILEVGLGGTWDATNAVPHSWSVVTPLGLDHQNLLGRTLPEIAANKLGIVQAGSVVVHAPFPEECSRIVQASRSRLGGRWIERVSFDTEVIPGDEPEFILRTRFGETRVGLPGARGTENAALALTAFEALGFDPRAHLAALRAVRWPGRMERVFPAGARCPVYLSGDHNPQGISSLVELLAHYPRRTLHILAGIGKDKDADGILKQLAELPGARIYLTQTPFKGLALRGYGKAWLRRAHGAWVDPREGLGTLLRSHAEPGDLVLVTGSLYLVGALRGECAESSRSNPG